MKKTEERLMLRTFQLGSEREENEGLRVGTVRYLPRGVPKAEYQKRDLFDLWLPILAPSRELLKDVRDRGLSRHQFFRRYRKEMAQTDSRQTIELLATVARRTPVTVGCYCTDESACHRSVLRELIRVAAGETAELPWAGRSIYTIAHPEVLRSIAAHPSGSAALEERRPWTSAVEILKRSAARGERVAIVFGDATDCSRLISAAQLDRVEIGAHGTTYHFSRLRTTRRGLSPQGLTLCSTGERIAEGFIRPYAIVETPRFVMK